MLIPSKPNTQEKINLKSIDFIDKILFMLYRFVMPLLTDAQRAIKQRLLAACERVRELRTEQKTLASAYERYNILQKELKQQEKRIDRLAGLIGPNLFLTAEIEDTSHVIEDTVETHTSILQLRNELSLGKRWWSTCHTPRKREFKTFKRFLRASELQHQEKRLKVRSSVIPKPSKQKNGVEQN